MNETREAKPRRRWLRYSLRSLLVLITVGCVALGLWVEGARRQRRAVELIRAAGGQVLYDYQDPQRWNFGEWERPSPPLPWISNSLGVDFVATPVSVWLDSTANDDTMAAAARFATLDRLGIHDADLGDSGLAHLRSLTALHTLSLTGCGLSDAGLVHVGALPNLDTLFLSGTNVTDAGLCHVSRSRSLARLHLDDTSIGDEGLAHLRGMVSLTSLDVSRTPLTDKGLLHLRGLSQLQNLYVEGTSVTQAGRELLWKSLPNCRIDW